MEVKHEKYAWQKSDKNPSKNPERRKQISEEKRGRVLSDETRAKISGTMKKRVSDNPTLYKRLATQNKGRIHTEETRAKISMAHNKKPKSVKLLKAELDTVFSQYIRKRDSQEYGEGRIGQCITCDQFIPAQGQRSGQAGHFISRRFNATRYDERNVHLQCARCNMWGAGEQYKYSIAIDRIYGVGTAEELYKKSQEVKKWTADELQELISLYKQKTLDLP